MELLLDADATINLRSLGLLTWLVESDVDLTWTSFVFEHELSGLLGELEPLRDRGRVNVYGLQARTRAFGAFKELKRQGLDKGEAEAIAWARDIKASQPRFFVSDDRAARRVAGDNPTAISTAECVALLVAMGKLDLEAARELLAVWDDQSKQHGRPKGWRCFDDDFPALLRGVERRFEGEIGR